MIMADLSVCILVISPVFLALRILILFRWWYGPFQRWVMISLSIRTTHFHSIMMEIDIGLCFSSGKENIKRFCFCENLSLHIRESCIEKKKFCPVLFIPIWGHFCKDMFRIAADILRHWWRHSQIFEWSKKKL